MGYYLIHYWNWYNRLLSYTLLATETVLAFLLLRLGGAGGDPFLFLLLTHFCRLNTSVQCYVHHIKYKGLNKLTCYDNTITF